MSDFERFYKYDTKSLTGWGKVSVIYIDSENKKYKLDIDVDERTIDSFDEEDNEYYSIEVSKDVFDMLVDGVNNKKYEKIV